MNIINDLTNLVGNTPLYYLERTANNQSLETKLYAKLEMFNPFGSSKDRAILAILKDGERKGFINRETVIIEPSGGNAASSLAYICAAKKYRLILTMPESIHAERRALMASLGAELHLTQADKGMNGAIEYANHLCEVIKNSFMPMQFQNPANPRSHRDTTGEEIWRDTDGLVDIVVAGFGTGGTISGIAEALKAHKPTVNVVGVEPQNSPVTSGGKPGAHRISGLGAGFLPINLNLDLIDEIIPVSDENAYLRTRELAKTEGLVCGVSSGAALDAAITVARRNENRGKTIVIIFPDHGERYLNQNIFTVEP